MATGPRRRRRGGQDEFGSFATAAGRCALRSIPPLDRTFLTAAAGPPVRAAADPGALPARTSGAVGSGPGAVFLKHGNPKMHVAVAERDLDLAASLDLGCDLVKVADDGTISGAANGSAIGSLALSSEGEAALDRAGTAAPLAVPGGDARLVLTDAPKDEWSARARVFLMEQLKNRVRTQAERNVALARELAVIRGEHDTTQTAFSQLETYVREVVGDGRRLTGSFLPATTSPTFTLTERDVIRQRLPGSSAGLSDVAISLAHAPDEDGELHVELLTAEDGRRPALWTVAAADLKKGWNRFSLPISLAADAMTAILALSWSGKGRLRLNGALRHPDTRFQAEHNGSLLGYTAGIMRWSYVPGCSCDVPADALVPSGRKVSTRVLSTEALMAAESRNASNPYFIYRKDVGGLVVHPIGTVPSIGLLREAAPPGTTAVRARIEGTAPDGPDAEYAIGVAPPAARPTATDTLPAFAAGALTEWHRLPSGVPAEINLPFKDGLDGVHDLYLLTRMPIDHPDISHSWATFKTIWVTR